MVQTPHAGAPVGIRRHERSNRVPSGPLPLLIAVELVGSGLCFLSVEPRLYTLYRNRPNTSSEWNILGRFGGVLAFFAGAEGSSRDVQAVRLVRLTGGDHRNIGVRVGSREGPSESEEARNLVRGGLDGVRRPAPSNLQRSAPLDRGVSIPHDGLHFDRTAGRRCSCRPQGSHSDHHCTKRQTK
jgi:hypothetical protein